MTRLLKTLVAAWIIGAALLLPTDSEAISIGFDPASAVVSLGDSLDIAIRVSDLGGEIVSAFDLDVSYDASVLSATGVTFGAFLNGGDLFWSLQAVDVSTAGLIDLAELSFLFDDDLAALQSDSLVLATLSFTALADGTSQLAFVPDQVFGVDVKGRNAEILDLDAGGGAVTVSARASVPEPSTWALLAVGVAGAMLFAGSHLRASGLRR